LPEKSNPDSNDKADHLGNPAQVDAVPFHFHSSPECRCQSRLGRSRCGADQRLGAIDPLVLIVDDDVAARALLASYLEREYRVALAESGAQALKTGGTLRGQKTLISFRAM